jgi:hypothetical protein
MANAIKVLDGYDGYAHQHEANEFLQKVSDVARNFYELLKEPLGTNNTRNVDLRKLTKEMDERVNPFDPDRERVLQLRDGQEIEITNGAMVPFLLGTRGLHETSYQGSMQPGGSAFVLKEFMGLKAILVCKYIPIWQEAWYSRRKIIGYKRVYYLKYVPCEYLKSIIYKDTIKGVEKFVKTIQHCDHALLSYWNFPLKR